MFESCRDRQRPKLIQTNKTGHFSLCAVRSGLLFFVNFPIPPAPLAPCDYKGLAPGNLADLVVLDVKVDATKPTALDPVAKATPAAVALVVVDGKPLYGNKDLRQRLLPAGAVVDSITVCGAEKAVYLAETEAGKRGWSLADIQRALNRALAKAGSSLAEIECN